MVGYELKTAILENVNSRINMTLSHRHLLLTSTHTHSAPGGYLTPFLFAISVKGVHTIVFDKIVNGCGQAIYEAILNRKPSLVSTAKGNIENVGINRSPR
jgi:neutral ceramidase